MNFKSNSVPFAKIARIAVYPSTRVQPLNSNLIPRIYLAGDDFHIECPTSFLPTRNSYSYCYLLFLLFHSSWSSGSRRRYFISKLSSLNRPRIFNGGDFIDPNRFHPVVEIISRLHNSRSIFMRVGKWLEAR